MAATPQTPTSGIGSSACSEACGVSEAWHWWQSLYRLSAKSKPSSYSPPSSCFPITLPKLFISILLHLHKPSSPRSFLNCSPPSSCPLAPGRWWWWEPRRCWRRRRGRPRSTPRKRWTSPSGTPGSGPGSHKSHPLNASAPCRGREGNRGGLQVVRKHVCCTRLHVLACTYCGHPSPVDTVKRVRRAQATLS